MQKKLIQFNQNLSHDIEDEDLAADYLELALPLVGEVVMYATDLERSIGFYICEMITDRTQGPGLIVIQKLQFSAKLDLFKRFAEDFQLSFGQAAPGFSELITELLEVTRLRNLVVHAEWTSMNEEGFTFVRLKDSSGGLMQEYVQFSVESLEKVIARIIAANHLLSDFWEWHTDLLGPHLRAIEAQSPKVK